MADAGGGGWLEAVGGFLSSVAPSAIGAAGRIYTNEQNLDFQRDVQQYMQAQQAKTDLREDTAIQRRVADLKAAGLSPVLAAGSGAATSSPIKIDPLKSEDALGTDAMLQGMAVRNQYAMTQSSLETAKFQRDMMKSQEALNAAKAANVAADTALKGVDFRYYDKTGNWPRAGNDAFGRIAKMLTDLSERSKKPLQFSETGKTAGRMFLRGLLESMPGGAGVTSAILKE